MSAKYLTVCSWCVEEGAQSRPSGPVSDGVCRRHASEILARLGLLLRRDADGAAKPAASEAAVEQKEAA